MTSDDRPSPNDDQPLMPWWHTTPTPGSPGAPREDATAVPPVDPSQPDPLATEQTQTLPPYGDTGSFASTSSAPTFGAPTSSAPTFGEQTFSGPPSTDQAPARRRGWKTPVAAGVAAIVLSLGSGVAGAELALRHDDGPATVATTVAETVKGGTSATQQLAKVAAAVQPSVVSITVRASAGSDEGSGVILRSDGTILTNNHVVESAAQSGTITITFSNGKTAEADLVGRDPGTDLAVVKARGVSGLKPITLGSTSSLHVGDTLLAIGSPLGLEGSVSSGIVSALHRPVNVGTTTLSDAIQTDAPINPGNSGGALVDSEGHLVGINSAIATLGGGGLGGSGQSGNIGVGFAIPIDAAKQVADQLIRGEKPTHAIIGVQISDATQGGALIESVTASGAASAAGIKAGDVITKVGGTKIDDATALSAAIRGHRPGDKVSVTYQRDGQDTTVTVTLGSAT